MIVPAYAKLNLTLDVIGAREDGYHEIASVMQAISLHDLLRVEAAECRIFETTGATIEGENLVLKAARALEGAVSRALPFRIWLHKRIPIGAGLGGGSADAAAFLRVAPALYGLRLDREQLHAIAVTVGQDVPFLMQGGTALATGLGSTVEPLPSLDRSTRFVVVCPRVSVSTATVYQAAPSSGGDARRSQAVAAALRAGQPLEPALLGNDLEPATLTRYPEVAAAIEPLRASIPGLRMTGTGAAFFARVKDHPAARAALEASRRAGVAAFVCHPIRALS
ncbi:MAG TPA: 4-(cytidine 5'-diphospho)-2-C-methyl-D-erythritol kinase [Candidatus Sulfotelmatobacter sp.]|nr:4-(cytidine 5'-diphospho)-2-C-methyl-D-erythritol kinase [Candidatus Sulfotelmatobacter sp.]